MTRVETGSATHSFGVPRLEWEAARPFCVGEPMVGSGLPAEDADCEAFRGKPIGSHTLAQQWKRLRKKAGVSQELWFHDLRRTSAVALYALTKDLTAVEAFLGHASLASTCGYLEHKDPGKLKPYIDQMWKPKGKETVQ